MSASEKTTSVYDPNDKNQSKSKSKSKSKTNPNKQRKGKPPREAKTRKPTNNKNKNKKSKRKSNKQQKQQIQYFYYYRCNDCDKDFSSKMIRNKPNTVSHVCNDGKLRQRVIGKEYGMQKCSGNHQGPCVTMQHGKPPQPCSGSSGSKITQQEYIAQAFGTPAASNSGRMTNVRIERQHRVLNTSVNGMNLPSLETNTVMSIHEEGNSRLRNANVPNVDYDQLMPDSGNDNNNNNHSGLTQMTNSQQTTVRLDLEESDNDSQRTTSEPPITFRDRLDMGQFRTSYNQRRFGGTTDMVSESKLNIKAMPKNCSVDMGFAVTTKTRQWSLAESTRLQDNIKFQAQHAPPKPPKRRQSEPPNVDETVEKYWHFQNISKKRRRKNASREQAMASDVSVEINAPLLHALSSSPPAAPAAAAAAPAPAPAAGDIKEDDDDDDNDDDEDDNDDDNDMWPNRPPLAESNHHNEQSPNVDYENGNNLDGNEALAMEMDRMAKFVDDMIGKYDSDLMQHHVRNGVSNGLVTADVWCIAIRKNIIGEMIFGILHCLMTSAANIPDAPKNLIGDMFQSVQREQWTKAYELWKKLTIDAARDYQGWEYSPVLKHAFHMMKFFGIIVIYKSKGFEDAAAALTQYEDIYQATCEFPRMHAALKIVVRENTAIEAQESGNAEQFTV